MLNRLQLTGAEALSRALVESGVQVVFGIPGVDNLALFEALRRSGIRIIPTTHEQGAAFMANGYGRATGKPGVFVTVPGPGLTNSLTPIAEALVDSTPMLGIVTDVPQSDRSFKMHEIRQTLLAQPIAKSVQAIESVSDLASAVKEMLARTRREEPGPCILQVPSNLFWERAEQVASSDGTPLPHNAPPSELDQVISRLKAAKRVGLFVGLGAADAAQEVCQLAEWMCAPVATTGSGRGVLDESHPLSLGFAWRGGSIDPVNRIFATCDLVLAIGAKFSQNGTHDYRLQIGCPIIHVDASAEVLGRNYKAEIAVRSDAGAFVRSLLEQRTIIEQRHDKEIRELIHAERRSCEARLWSNNNTTLFIGEEALTPVEFFEELRRLLPADAILVTDAGYHERLTIQNWLVHQPRTLINPSNYESMGFAIPTAIGAAVAFPERSVVAIVGDGGLVMSGLELMTAVRENINLTIIVLNNNGFGIIKKIQQDFFGASVAVDVNAPNFKVLAESIRMNFQSTSAGISALGQAIHHSAPTLLEVKMQHREESEMVRLGRRLKNDIKQGLQRFIH